MVYPICVPQIIYIDFVPLVQLPASLRATIYQSLVHIY